MALCPASNTPRSRAPTGACDDYARPVAASKHPVAVLAIVALATVAGCSFRPGDYQPPAVDAAPIDAAIQAFCPVDPHLRLCFSFDQPTFGGTLANEGAASTSAQLTNVTRIASGAGGAAQLDATSTVFVPASPEVTNIQAIEIWYRADSQPVNDGERMGLVDSNTTSNISLFLYRRDPSHELRCGIGDATIVWAATLTTATWIYLACVCENGNLKMYVDGTKIGDTAAACASGGTIVADGFTIGSNNNGGSGFPVTDWLLGAIDGIRLWDQPVTPAPP